MSFENAALSAPFSQHNTNYVLSIDDETEIIKALPEAYNKNYQVRTYLNGYDPDVAGAEIKRTSSFTVADGDVISIGVGNPTWPSMNSWVGTADETVYTVTVVCAAKHNFEQGDVDLNSLLSIDDATIVQRYLAEYEDLDPNRYSIADFDGDGIVTIFDVTAIQVKLAEA